MHYNEFSIQEKILATKKALKENDREMLDQILETKLTIFNEATKIAAFDFEFAQINGKKEIVEVGIAFFNKETESIIGKHFIIKGMKELMNRPSTPIEHIDMFAYGESNEVSLPEALKHLASAGEHSDIMLSFTPIDRAKFLKNNDMADFRFLNVNQLMKIKNGTVNNPSLSGTIQDHCVTAEQPINNAGNDAMATLEITSQIFGDSIDFKDFTPIAKHDFSQDTRMVSGEEIQNNRAALRDQGRNKKKTISPKI